MFWYSFNKTIAYQEVFNKCIINASELIIFAYEINDGYDMSKLKSSKYLAVSEINDFHESKNVFIESPIIF